MNRTTMDLKFGQKALFIFSICVTVAVIQSASVPDSDGRLHDRVIRGGKLSEREHFEHEEGDDVHDADYDHEAFLGKDDAHEFDQLTPGEKQ